MTADQFRRLAFELPGAVESAHHRHPDFRVGNKIFATLAYPNSKFGMVRLTPAQQAEVVGLAPEVFQPVAGTWGRSGSTLVNLSAARVTELRAVLRQAYDNFATPRKRSPRRS
jgi:hypothetical protein